MRKRWRFACVVLVAVQASVAGAQHVVTESGTISGLRLQRNPIRCPADGRLALASPGTCHILDWHA
jgi:hypothetical protein